MSGSRLSDGLLNAALLVGGLAVLVLLYGFVTRTFTPRTVPERAAAEDHSRIQVEVRNAAGVDGLAAGVTAHLRRRGFDVVDIGNAPARDTTTVVVRSGTALDARYVAQALGLGAERVDTGGPTTDYSLDVTVYVGADYRALASYDSD